MKPTTIRRHPRRAWLACLTAGAAVVATALTPYQPAFAAASPAEFAAAFVAFDHAADDSGAVDTAATQFTRLSAADPADPVLRAYAGAATTMRATTTWLPWKKLSFAEDGLALIDKAIAQLTPAHDQPAYRGTPASLETRFVAASTWLAMPSMMNRHDRGVRQLAEVQASPLFNASPLPFRAAVWLRVATEAAANQHPDEARRLLQQVIASGASQAPAAQARLNGIKP
jgi:hypothetical protein